MSLSPCCRPITACQPPPCPAYCIPPPPYYYQTPCTSYPFPPCTPCYPPPRVCQQPCSPCTQCNPSSCCPPPPCCKPCMPKSACCGGGGVRNGTTPIISVERRAQIIFGGCGPSPNSGGGQKKSGGGQKSSNNDQQSSFNNCNFYLTEVPPSLRDKFGLKSNYGGNDECTEEEATTVCTEETEDTEDCTTISRDDEDECDDYESIGRDRDDYGCQEMTQGNQWNPCFPPMFNPFFPYCFPFFPFGMDMQGACGMGGQGASGRGGHGASGRSGQGASGRDGQVANGRGGQGANERGGQCASLRGEQGASGKGGQGGFGRGGGGASHCVKGSGVRNGRDGHDRGGAPYGSVYNRENDNGRGNGNLMQGNAGNRNPNAGSGVEGNPNGRYTANDNCNRPSRRGLGSCANMRSNHSIRRVGSKKSKMSTTGKRLKSGTTSRILSRMSGYRSYTYSNQELTQKSSAYLPEKYDKLPPHTFNKSIHPSRAPISNYSRYNPTETEMQMTMVEYSEGKSLHGTSNTTRPAQRGDDSLLGPSNATQTYYSGANSLLGPSNTTRPEFSQGQSTCGTSNVTRTDYNGGKSLLGPSNATRPAYTGKSVATSYAALEYTGMNSSCVPLNATRPEYTGGNSLLGPSNATRTEYSGAKSSYGPSNATRTEYSGVKSSYGPSNATRPDYNEGSSLLGPSISTRHEYNGGNSTVHYTQHVRFPTASSKSSTCETQAQMSGAPTQSCSEPNVSKSASYHDNKESVPIYRTSTQTSLQIIDKANTPSEIRVIQRPVQIVSGYQTNDAATQNCHEDAECGSGTTGTGTEDVCNKRKRKKRANDHCHPKCLKPHARRLHRLCSITNRRTKRLSEIHEPIFSFEPPPCPIRETFASILRKKPPITCKMHDVDVPPYHEYCMTNHCPDTNRYPLLTRDDHAETCGEDQNLSNQHQGARHNRSEKNSRTIHTRGAKRKQHHR